MKNPISDLLSDWLTILQSKSAGINAYETYLRHAQAEHSQECIDLLNRLRDQEVRMTEEICRHLGATFADELRQPGRVDDETAGGSGDAPRTQAAPHTAIH